MLGKGIVVIFMLIILYSLGSALYYLINDKTGTGMVKALSYRIGLSVALFALLFVGYFLGLIQPHGLGG